MYTHNIIVISIYSYIFITHKHADSGITCAPQTGVVDTIKENLVKHVIYVIIKSY